MNSSDLSLIKNSSAKREIFNSLSRAGSINKTEKYEKTLRKHSTQRSLKYNRTVTFKQLRPTVIDNITRTAAEIFFFSSTRTARSYLEIRFRPKK